MKPTSKILSVLIATQIAFSCFALAVESTKTAVTTSAKTAVATTTGKTTGKTTAKKKLAQKKISAKVTKAKSATKKASTTKANEKVATKSAALTPAIATSTSTAVAEPKEAIETEIETIDQMEAAAVKDAAKQKATTTAKTVTASAASTSSVGTAVTPTTTSTTTTPATEETSWFKPSISLGATYNMAAEAPKEGEQNRYMDYDIIPTVIIGPVKTLVWFKYSQSLINNSESEWQDFPISFSPAKPFNAGDYLTLSPALVFTIPQTRATKDNVQLNYSANANVTIGLNTKTLGWDGVVLNFQTGYTKMNNEFTTSAKGEPIVSYRLRQRVNFWYPIYGTLNFKSRLEFNSTFSYENVVKNDFVHFVALEYGFLERYNVNIGTANGGPVLAGPNYENNLKFYNDTSSEYFLGVGADF